MQWLLPGLERAERSVVYKLPRNGKPDYIIALWMHRSIPVHPVLPVYRLYPFVNIEK